MRRTIHPRVILITDPTFGDDVIVRCVGLVAGALPAGWLCVQLRDKRRPRVSLRLFASRLRLVTRGVDASLVINGDAAIARDVAAEGVHVGRGGGTVSSAKETLGDDVWISVAAHSDDEVRAGVDAGADAVIVSPIFSTRAPSIGSAAKVGRTIGALRSARAIAGERAAVYALGGVTGDNTRSCVTAGADGVAVTRAFLASAEPARMARAIHDAVAHRC